MEIRLYDKQGEKFFLEVDMDCFTNALHNPHTEATTFNALFNEALQEAIKPYRTRFYAKMEVGWI